VYAPHARIPLIYTPKNAGRAGRLPHVISRAHRQMKGGPGRGHGRRITLSWPCSVLRKGCAVTA